MAFAMAADAVSAWPPDLATRPSRSAYAHRPSTQPLSTGSDSRTESPTWPESKVVRGRRCERSASTPDPRSRRPARAIAAPPSATHSAATGTSTHGLGCVSGWSSSTQPSGVAHRSHSRPVPESATMRRA